MTPSLPTLRNRFKPSQLTGELKHFQKHPLATVNRWAQAYPGCAKVKLGFNDMFIVSAPEYIQQVYQKHHRSYIKVQRTMDILRRTNNENDNLFTSEGAFWLRQRRLMQPAFHRKVLADYGALMTDVVQSIAQTWHEHPKHKPINAYKAMIDLTMEVMSRAFLGVEQAQEFQRIQHLFRYMLHYVVRYTFAPIRPPLWLPTKSNRYLRTAYNEIEQLLSKTVNQRRQAIEQGDQQRYLLDLILMLKDEETQATLSHGEVIAELIGIVIAGHETTAATLGFLWYVLAQHPEVEAKLHEELDRVLAGRIPSIDDLQHMPYLQMVLNETLRMYPPLWISTRQAVKPDYFGEVLVPPDATVMINIYGVHHHPNYWDKPEEFRPERFEQEPIKGSFIPFGTGPRKCIGDMFAQVEAQLTLAMLAQQFRLRWAPQASFRPRARFLLEPANQWMLLEAR